MALAATLVYAAHSENAGPWTVEVGSPSFRCAGGETIIVDFSGVQNTDYADVTFLQPDGSGKVAAKNVGAYNAFFSSSGTMGGFGQLVNAQPGTYFTQPPPVLGGNDGLVRIYVVTGAPQGFSVRTVGKTHNVSSSQTITVTTVGNVQVGDMAFGRRSHENTAGFTDTIGFPAGWTDDVQMLNGTLTIPTDNCHLLIASGGGSPLSGTWTSQDTGIADTGAAIIVLSPNATGLQLTNPQPAIVSAGGFATFTTTPSGATGTVHYQWSVNGVNVGLDSATLLYQPAPGETVSLVQVVGTDDNGSWTSFPAKLRVLRVTKRPRRRRQTQSYDNSGTNWFKAELLPASAFNFDPSLFALPSGGGTTWNLSVGESMTAADAPSNILSTSPAIAESSAATDAPSAIAIRGAAIQESATAADAPSAVSVTAATISESATSTDAPAAVIVTPVAAAESLATADTPSAMGALVGAVAEASTAADAPSAVMTTGQAVAESVSAADAPGVAAVLAIALAESAAGTDAPAAAVATSQATAESSAASDAPASALAMPQAVAEAAAGIDAPAAIMTSPQTVTEAATAADQPSTNAAVAGSISEAATGLDSPAASVASSQAVAEALSASDATAAGAILTALMAESSALAEAVSGIAVLGVSLAEALAASDLVNQGLSVSAGVAEAASASDAAAAERIVGALIVDALAATDATGASAVIVAEALESMDSLDLLDATRVFALALAELAQAADGPSTSGLSFSLGVDESAATIDSARWLAIAYNLLRTFTFPVYARDYRFSAYPRTTRFPPLARSFAFPAYSRIFKFTTD